MRREAPALPAAGVKEDMLYVGLPSLSCLCWSCQLLQRQQTKPINMTLSVWCDQEEALSYAGIQSKSPQVILVLHLMASGAPVPRGIIGVLPAGSVWSLACSYHSYVTKFWDHFFAQPSVSR